MPQASNCPWLTASLCRPLVRLLNSQRLGSPDSEVLSSLVLAPTLKDFSMGRDDRCITRLTPLTSYFISVQVHIYATHSNGQSRDPVTWTCSTPETMFSYATLWPQPASLPVISTPPLLCLPQPLAPRSLYLLTTSFHVNSTRPWQTSSLQPLNHSFTQISPSLAQLSCAHLRWTHLAPEYWVSLEQAHTCEAWCCYWTPSRLGSCSNQPSSLFFSRKVNPPTTLSPSTPNCGRGTLSTFHRKQTSTWLPSPSSPVSP